MKRNAARKEKFGLLNFGSVEVLSKEEMKKVTGGYGGPGGCTKMVNDVRCTSIGGSTTVSPRVPTSTDPCPWYANPSYDPAYSVPC